MFALVVNSLPEVCDFKILVKDVVLKLIFADKKEALGNSLPQFVHEVLVLNVYGLFVHKRRHFAKLTWLSSLFLLPH